MATPARSIHKIGRRRVIGSFASAKMREMVEWESQIERDFLYHLEFDHDVIRYVSQPIKFRFSQDNKYHYHYPDFEIFRHSTPKRKFIEIKPYHITQKPEFIEKTEAIKAKMFSEGFDYAVITDNEIRIEPILSNLKLLYRYKLHEYSLANVNKLVQALQSSGLISLTFSQLEKIAQEFSLELIDCYSCIANKVFDFDIKVPLTENTLLIVADRKLR